MTDTELTEYQKNEWKAACQEWREKCEEARKAAMEAVRFIPRKHIRQDFFYSKYQWLKEENDKHSD